jgi:drug/metabolite transporter, DME family
MSRSVRPQAPLAGLPLVLGGASLWGTDALLRAPLAAVLPPVAIVLAQYLLLALVAAPVVVHARRAFTRLPRAGWLALLGIAWGSAALGMVLFTAAYRHGNPTVVVLLLNLQPLFAVLLAIPLLRERPPARYWPSAAVALVGTSLLAFGGGASLRTPAGTQALALGCALGAAALWGGATVLGRCVLTTLTPTALTAARYLLALPALVALALVQGQLGAGVSALAHYPVRLALLALLPGLAGMLLYYRGLRHTRAAYATLGELACPASALVLNRLVLGVAVAPAQLAGFAILWLAIAALTWSPAGRPAWTEQVWRRTPQPVAPVA